ncbi:hypothetical protein GmRootV213_38530 [Variovorax sp. V213]|uniref:hypothetical protein n=1 Tax=Variovorax sp. V213 TaxID=3065955 RepID=UPI0034E876B2
MSTSSSVSLSHSPFPLLTHARFLTCRDLPALLALEGEKWDAIQAASSEDLLQRLEDYPNLSVGAFCTNSGTLLASLFMRPVHADFWCHAASWVDCVDSPRPGRSHSLFGISLSSSHPSGVEALLEFFWPHALKSGWRHIYLGSPIPGFEGWLQRHRDRSVQDYIALQRAGIPVDPQLRYYHGRGFKDIVCVKRDYFPHARSLDHGVILRGTVPLSLFKPVWKMMPLTSAQRVTRHLVTML